MEEVKLKDLKKDIKFNNKRYECKFRNFLTCIFVFLGILGLLYLVQFIPR